MPVNDTDVTVEIVSENFGGHDCLTWVAQALSVPAPEPPGTGGPPVVGGIAGLLEGGPQAPAAAGDGQASSWTILAIALAAGLAGFMVLSSGAAVLAYRRRRISR